jgi:hypothetical protein
MLSAPAPLTNEQVIMYVPGLVNDTLAAPFTPAFANKVFCNGELDHTLCVPNGAFAMARLTACPTAALVDDAVMVALAGEYPLSPFWQAYKSIKLVVMPTPAISILLLFINVILFL